MLVLFSTGGFLRHFLISLGLLWSVGASASTGIHLLDFHVGGIGAIQPGVGNSFSGQIGWAPAVGLGSMGIRGELGFTLFKNTLGDKFLATNYEGFLQFDLLALMLEVGGGLKNWSGNGGMKGAIGANVVLPFIGSIRGFYAGYSRFFLGDGVHEIRAGIVLSL